METSPSLWNPLYYQMQGGLVDLFVYKMQIDFGLYVLPKFLEVFDMLLCQHDFFALGKEILYGIVYPGCWLLSVV